MGPPFRADHVGSLLRPDAIRSARAAHFGDGSVSAQQLKDVEDREIAKLVAMQYDVGLPAATDGELRRSFWHYDFMAGLTGFDLVERGEGIAFKGAELRPVYPTISGRLDFPADHPMLDHFRYLASLTEATPKISIPGPTCCHYRTAAADIAPPEYRDLELLLDDLSRTYAKAVQAFYDAGCRYLQFDDIFIVYLCDEEQRAAKREQGFDPDRLILQYAEMIERSIQDRPDDLTIAMHLCRGNFRSTWMTQGGFDPAVDAIFNHTSVDVYFMEYDSDRAGGLEPLALLPKGDKRVMPGFITTKVGEAEKPDDLRRRLDEASSYVDLAQLGIAPQCGFASTEEGNKISEDDQRRKLELVVQTAEAIWGSVTA